MTNEKRQDGCAEWCGLPYKDDRVPYNPNLQGQRADGSSLPWGISDRDGAEQTDPAYCTAACLERAQEKPVKRDPVAPWVRFEKLGGKGESGFGDTFDWVCTAGHMELGSRVPLDAYGISKATDDLDGACEACAERAGVFGPVNTYTPVGTAVASPEHVMTFLDETADVIEKQWRAMDALLTDPVKIWDMPVEMVELPPDPPTCAGPLATHGTPVLRWRRDLFGEGSALLLLCDACHLECEQMLMNRKRIAEAGRGVRSTEPPARIGTVPQVVSVGVGIWASRGMRKVRP